MGLLTHTPQSPKYILGELGNIWMDVRSNFTGTGPVIDETDEVAEKEA